MSASAAYRDFDYERRFSDVKRLEKAVEHFNQAVMRGMVAMKEIASAFEAVGGVLSEMTSANSAATYHIPPTEENPGVGVGKGDVTSFSPFTATAPNDNTSNITTTSVVATNTAATSAPWESASMVGSTNLSPIGQVNDDTAAQMHRLTVLFASEARRLNEGQPFLLYNTGVHRDVVNRLLPVVEHLKAVDVIAKKCDEALSKYQKCKTIVEKKERQYAKKGKPFVDQGSYRKYVEKRDGSWKTYVEVRSKFYNSYRLLMEVHGNAVAHIIHRYLNLNGGYLRELLFALERVLPAMESIYPTNAEFGSQAQSILTVVAPMKEGDKTVIASQVNKEETKKEVNKDIGNLSIDKGNVEDDKEVQSIHSHTENGLDVERPESYTETCDENVTRATLEMRLPGAAENTNFLWNSVSDQVGPGVFSSVDTAPAGIGEGRGLYFLPSALPEGREAEARDEGLREMKYHDDGNHDSGGKRVAARKATTPPPQQRQEEGPQKEKGGDESQGGESQRAQAIYADPLAGKGLHKQ
ncbi:hypothetical protein LSM04_008756 [Trypanosoma melophagium]|uniref:uncharacterized protein n=1 Tax=Trypanosoma melophagium TaxID=715481 RepID=UPI00351A6EFC|nr:hypothetical protein LSM04_008756 [Trypanosoma melophagium]